MKTRSLLSLLIISCCGLLRAATYYAHPEKGQSGNPGTATAPWPSLAQLIKDGKLAELQPGDQLLLGSGYHGMVKISGNNSSAVTIAAAPENRPQLGRLEISSGSNWVIRGLEISPSLAEQPYKGAYIVTVGETADASDIVVEDCFVHSTKDTSGWSARDWMTTYGGMLQGRRGKNLIFRNNYVQNVRWGITMTSFDSKAMGNVVSDFSGDAIRVTRDDLEVGYNVIKNIYVGSKDGDNNHDDAIQCFVFNKGTGTMRNLHIHHNYLHTREDDNQKWKTDMQGIGLFDGPLINFKVHDNVMALEHWHGVSLFDAQNCLVENNVIYNPWGGRLQPWVMLGSKKNLARGNTVRNNYAHSIRLGADKSVNAEGNGTSTESMLKTRSKQLLNEINEKYGAVHPVAKRGRLGK